MQSRAGGFAPDAPRRRPQSLPARNKTRNELMADEDPNLDLMLADVHLLRIIRELEESYNIPA